MRHNQQQKTESLRCLLHARSYASFVSIQPDIAISDLVRDIKSNSSSFIKERNFANDEFSWQKGFGAFSYSKSQSEQVVNYILNQRLHHQKRSFKEEYLEFLKKYEVSYDEKYLFEFYE